MLVLLICSFNIPIFENDCILHFLVVVSISGCNPSSRPIAELEVCDSRWPGAWHQSLSTELFQRKANTHDDVDDDDDDDGDYYYYYYYYCTDMQFTANERLK